MKQPRKLTIPEINHILELLESRKQEGSYFGPRDQYYARTERLILWCNEQVKGNVDERNKDSSDIS